MKTRISPGFSDLSKKGDSKKTMSTQAFSPAALYARTVCINLLERPQRWEIFQAGLPECLKNRVQRYPGIRGENFEMPKWWGGHSGAYGCYLAHRRLLEECLNDGTPSVLVFQDDAEFVPDFAQRAAQFHAHLPVDAQWIFYGGQHLRKEIMPPEKINEHVYIPHNVNRLHAFALRGPDVMRLLHRYLCETEWTGRFNTDHRLGEIQMARAAHVYCPARWLVHQRPGHSDLERCWKDHPRWMDARDIP